MVRVPQLMKMATNKKGNIRTIPKTGRESSTRRMVKSIRGAGGTEFNTDMVCKSTTMVTDKRE